MKAPIKNIIFDLGGVFLNIDFQLTNQAFIDLGVIQFNEMFTQHFSNPLFELLETGKINEEEFYTAFRKESKTNLSNEQIKRAWNALLLDFPKERIDWLKNISKKYRIFLFSNTNQIHYDSFTEKFEMQHPGEDFDSLFIKAYYSQNLGLRKPYPESFQAICDEQVLEAHQTVFIVYYIN